MKFKFNQTLTGLIIVFIACIFAVCGIVEVSTPLWLLGLLFAVYGLLNRVQKLESQVKQLESDLVRYVRKEIKDAL